MYRRFFAVGFAIILSACGGQDLTFENSQQLSVLEVDNAFIVRPATGRDITGAGMTISVIGPETALIAAESEIADSIELHTMAMEDDVMRMRKVDSFDISEGAPLVLERGGDHLMLFGVKETIHQDESADVLLTFRNEKGETQTLVTRAEIRALGD